MGILIGYLIKIVTLPGLIIDTIINKWVCDFLNIPIHHINYIPLDPEKPAIIYEIPNSYTKTWALAFFPFLLATALAISVFYIGLTWGVSIQYFFIWIGVSIGAHAFPEYSMGDLLWKQSIAEIKQGNYFAVLGIPFVGLIYGARFLHYLWLDIIYGLLLYFLVKDSI